MTTLTVHGYPVTPEIEAAVLTRMRQGSFRAAHIEDAVEEKAPAEWVQKQPGYITRVADRLIQRERRAGNIALEKGRSVWAWKGPTAEPAMYTESPQPSNM